MESKNFHLQGDVQKSLLVLQSQQLNHLDKEFLIAQFFLDSLSICSPTNFYLSKYLKPSIGCNLTI
jgi:hypothetical protein